MKTKPTLRFGNANAKLKQLAKNYGVIVKTFSLPSGHSCPGAMDCLSKANRNTGKITDGPDTEFRCFQASAEALYPSLRKMVWHNFELIKTEMTSAWRYNKDKVKTVADLISNSLPKKFDVMRVHVGGDFFSQVYFDAWMEVARRNPDKLFYSYSKSLNLWVNRLTFIPVNFSLTASRGGKHDWLITEHGLKCAEVVFAEEQADAQQLEIDHDDSHAAYGTESFALLLHGTQPKGSAAAEALREIKRRERVDKLRTDRGLAPLQKANKEEDPFLYEGSLGEGICSAIVPVNRKTINNK